MVLGRLSGGSPRLYRLIFPLLSWSCQGMGLRCFRKWSGWFDSRLGCRVSRKSPITSISTWTFLSFSKPPYSTSNAQPRAIGPTLSLTFCSSKICNRAPVARRKVWGRCWCPGKGILRDFAVLRCWWWCFFYLSFEYSCSPNSNF